MSECITDYDIRILSAISTGAPVFVCIMSVLKVESHYSDSASRSVLAGSQDLYSRLGPFTLAAIDSYGGGRKLARYAF